MTPRQMQVVASKYSLKSPYAMTPKYITIHNTANDASANNEISYMRNNATATSFHFAVDDTEVVQGLPVNRNGFHAGDGNGEGNRASIGIEICYSKSGGARFDAAERNAAKFTAQLLKERGWDISRVKKHQDWSGKYCPHRTLDMGWKRFLNMVQAELTPKTPPAAPKPAPTTPITYAEIPKKSIELIRDANLWDFNFTDWSKAKPVQSRKSGAVIENVVAIATNPVGAKYYVTEYSYVKKIANGFNINDAKDYFPPAPVEPPVVVPPVIQEPEPVPETPKTDTKDDEQDKRLGAIEALLKVITDFLSKIFNGFGK